MRAAAAISSMARIRLGGGDVLAHRAAEQEAVLQHDADALAQMHEIDLAAVEAVDPHQPLLDRIEALDQPGERRLAGAALADDAEDRAGGNGERDVVERRRAVRSVAERDILELDAALQVRPASRARGRTARAAGS